MNNLILPPSLPDDPIKGLQFTECFLRAKRIVSDHRAKNPLAFDPMCGRQLFADGPYIDPPVANLTTLSNTSIEDIWTSTIYTPIFANDPKAGKIYHVRAGGTISLTGGTGIITPQLNTSSTALGASLTVGTVTATIAAWYLAFDLVIRTVGTAGTCIGTGYFVMNGGVVSGTANPNMIVFGGTSAAINTTVNDAIQIRKTLSATNSMIPQFVYIYSNN